MGLLAGTILLAGCNSAPVSTPKVTKAKPAPAEELGDIVHEALQKSDDLAACRRLTEQFNVALTRPGVTLKPAPLSAELKAGYAQALALTPRELEEVTHSEFTPLDAYALEEAFLFRDIARALDVAPLHPLERARAALAWVVRNVREIESTNLAAPPTFVVMRGAGSGLERTYVFLSLLRQLDLDAGLLGDSSGQPAGIWGVVLRTDEGLHVFDARLGLPLPGPNGGVATLAQVRSDENVLKPLTGDSKLSYDVTLERAKSSHIFVAEPLSALSTRFKFLQTYLPLGAGRITGDLPALRERFANAVKGPGLEGCEVRTWTSAAPDAWQRALMSFLPPGEGGTDRVEAAPPRRDRFVFEQVPWDIIPPFLLQLAGEPGDRIRAAFGQRALALRAPGQARDLLVRGQFQEATEQLVALQQKMNTRSISDPDLEDNSRKWAAEAKRMYADLYRAERAAKTDPTGSAAAEVIKFKEQTDLLWKRSIGPSMFLDVLAAKLVNDESTFLLALSKHEQAERLGHRPRSEKNAAAWETTRKWWIQFLNTYPNSPLAGMARRNLGIALANEGSKGPAKAEFVALAGADTLVPLERLACLVMAAQLK
jgi:hypothetical protein